MSEPFPPGTPDPAELTDAQRAFLAQQAAAQAVQSPSPAADQAAAAAQMAAAERGPVLPAESAIDQMMALIKAQSEQLEALQSQVGVMQKQAEEAQAVVGGPPVIRYAQAVAEKIAALKAAHPDLGAGHFDVPAAAADELVTAATDLSKNGGASDAVESAAGKLDRWLTRTHWRTGRKFIDFSALADDAERAVDEALKLAA